MIVKVQDVDIYQPLPLASEPLNWRFGGELPMGAVYFHRRNSMKVLRSLDTMPDGQRLLHVSVSRNRHLPSWDDLKQVKNVFMGEEVDAFHVIPATSDHVNMHNYCMHLWTPWEEYEKASRN